MIDREMEGELTGGLGFWRAGATGVVIGNDAEGSMIIIILWSYGLGTIWLIKVHG
jgi:hypothetical protein